MIDFKKVSFTYPIGVTALKSINIHIGRGERVGLIGQNGSGKTTLMKLCNGLLKPTVGKVFIDGGDTIPMTIAKPKKTR